MRSCKFREIEVCCTARPQTRRAELQLSAALRSVVGIRAHHDALVPSSFLRRWFPITPNPRTQSQFALKLEAAQRMHRERLLATTTQGDT